jgi:hypothetical protein
MPQDQKNGVADYLDFLRKLVEKGLNIPSLKY